jgi:hypothetical protein
VSFGPKKNLCCGRSYYTDPYNPYDYALPYGFGTKIEVALSTDFKVDFNFMFIVLGPYRTVCTTDCGHKKRGTKVVVQQYGFGTKNEANFYGTDLVL